MRRMIGITAMIAVVASAVMVLGVGSRSVADEPSEPPVISPQVLYYAPAANRNITMDAHMLELRSNGTEVLYVTDCDKFVAELGTTWSRIFVVDIPEEELDSVFLAAFASDETLIFRIDTGGATSQTATRVVDFQPSELPDGWSMDLEIGFAAVVRVVALGCSIEWAECRGACIGCTEALTTKRRTCDRCCNNAFALCEQGTPIDVDCCEVARKSGLTTDD